MKRDAAKNGKVGGIKKGYDKRTAFSIRLHPEVKKKIKEEASKCNRSQGNFIEHLVSIYRPGEVDIDNCNRCQNWHYECDLREDWAEKCELSGFKKYFAPK